MTEEQIKPPRDISGIFFRFQDPVTKKWGNRVFEDLPLSEQQRVMEGRSIEWLQSLAAQLANSLRDVCDHFDIKASVGEPPKTNKKQS